MKLGDNGVHGVEARTGDLTVNACCIASVSVFVLDAHMRMYYVYHRTTGRS